MAHETVHLLDPIAKSDATYYEEGVATAFSLEVQSEVTELVGRDGKYKCAMELANQVPSGALASGRVIR